ncbi:MAG: sigma-70 family RNA polymerase sigma factor [Phycisphaerae bacterium]|nr:sigma-70 family RNA polymerase sigma factor [Phycisphaerae bacterium]
MRDKNATAGKNGRKGNEQLPKPRRAAAVSSDSAGRSDPLADALQRNAQGLWRFLLVRVGGDENLAEELMQELCLQASRTGAGVDRTEHIDAWLFGVARNVLRRHWRTITRRRRNLPEARLDVGTELADMLDGEPLPNDYIERREVRQQVLLALTALPTDDQNLILQHYFDGQSQADIAAALDVSVRAIEGRLYRARQTLRERLRHLEDELR